MTQFSRIFATGLLFAALFATPALTKQMVSPDASLSGSYLAGRTAGHIRDTSAAADYLAAALKQDPRNSALVERLFQLRLAEGNMAEAERFAEQVIQANSQQRMARTVLGLREFRNRRYDQARAHFAEAAYTPVGELTSVLLTAWSYAGEGSQIAALKELDKLDGNESFANFKSFHVALISDYLANAIRADAAYKKAYEDAGTSLRVTQAYGNYLERNGRYAEAGKIYDAFLNAGDRNVLIEAARARLAQKTAPQAFVQTPGAGAAEALFSLAAAMNDDQSIDVALLFGQLALSFNADRPVVLTLLGDILAGTQNYQAAIDVFEQVPAASELRINADTEIAVNLQRLDKPADAQSRMQSVVTRDPRNFDAWVTLGNLHRNMEAYGKAVESYNAALAIVAVPMHEHWTVFYYRGIAFERLKMWDKSESDFRKALALSPEEPSVLNYLGYSLIDKNLKLEEALGMVKRAVELRPNDGYIVDSLGWAYFQMGSYEEAVVHMERAVDLKPGDPIIAQHLGDAYWRVGRRLEAKFQWQHAKDNKPDAADLAGVEERLKDGLPALPAPTKPAENAGTSNSNG